MAMAKEMELEPRVPYAAPVSKLLWLLLLLLLHDVPCSMGLTQTGNTSQASKVELRLPFFVHSHPQQHRLLFSPATSSRSPHSLSLSPSLSSISLSLPLCALAQVPICLSKFMNDSLEPVRLFIYPVISTPSPSLSLLSISLLSG